MSAHAINAYLTQIRKTVESKGRVFIVEAHKLRPLGFGQGDALIRTQPSAPLQFPDGGYMEVEEFIHIDSTGEVKRKAYSFHYVRGDQEYYFRYDKDPGAAQPLVHAICHLHVNDDNPRYISHETCFEEVFEFIWENFYAPGLKRKT